ncbi:hypothetical protein EXE43_08145 [Halorubrum sp. SS5]|nr:hypothetical protein EXE43_08145 [Halorubrum sp. SS5]
MATPPTADALPAAIVDRDQWVCWRTQERDGKPTKVPIIPGTTQFASTTDPDTWTDFATAREGVLATPVDGLGFVFTADDPLVGVDLDDCRDPDEADPTAWASDLIDTLDSYTEVSPSGTGFHVLVTGSLPAGRNRAGDLELYDRARFFTVTGDHVAATPATIESRTEAVATVVEQELAAETDDTATASGDDMWGTAEPTTTTDSATADAGANSVPLSDDELLDRAKHAANGEKFTRLWNGTTSGYESHSEADMALCRQLAFWTGGDSARVDRLFRRSGLYREKWDTVHYADGSTYGEKTIERAVAATDDTYTPPEATASAAADATQTTAGPAGRSAPEQPASSNGSDDPSPPPATDETLPPDERAAEHTPYSQRAAERRKRIAELTDRIEALIEENDRLRTELEAERQRRHELEAAREESSGGWWPFANE